MTQSTAQVPVAITLHAEELVLELKSGETLMQAQLTPQAALELAQSLLTAGLEHAALRAEMRLLAEDAADAALRKANH